MPGISENYWRLRFSTDVTSVVFWLSVRLEQGTVTSLVEENGAVKGVQYKTKNGQEMMAYAPLTIVCDGCFSNLRRSLCTPKVNTTHCAKFSSLQISLYQFSLL